MSPILAGEYELLNRRTGEFEKAWIKAPIEPSHIDDFNDHWRPIFKGRIEELKQANEYTPERIEELQIQDAHWSWPKKREVRANRLDWASFAIEADGHTQGLMFLELTGVGQEESQRKKPIVKVDLLATAPWNRAGLVDKPKYRGVGLLLMAAAVSKSVADEFGGRIGLHALPQSERFYREVCGMADLGVDKTRMRYFEMTEERAKKFMERDW